MECRFCGAPIEATVRAQAQISGGAFPSCIECAITFAEKAESKGKLEGVSLSPEVEDAFARGVRAEPSSVRLAAMGITHPYKGTENK